MTLPIALGMHVGCLIKTVLLEKAPHFKQKVVIPGMV